jgi:hypothetical protein
MPSAQNGQEMKYYQEGLDWRPKTISKNGSVIKDDMGQTEYPIAQEGRTITIDEGDGKKRKILTDSSEYAKLYNEGRIGVQNDDDESISFNPLNEVVVTPYDKQYPFYQELSDEEKKYFNSDTPIGRQLRSRAQDNVGFNADKATDFAMGWLRDLPLASLQAPQSALVEGVEALRGNDFNMLNALEPDKQRIPSETWGVENPYAAFAVDALTDPETLMGMSLLKNPLQKGIKQLGNIPTSISPELRQGLQTNGISFVNNPKRGENAFKLINDDNKEWIGDLDLTKNYWDDAAENQWTIDNVGIEKPYRGKGFGKEAYIKANELLNSTGRGNLYSSGNFEGPDAKHLWRSLVKSGEAEEIGKNAWKFKSKFEQGGIIKDDRGQWDHPGEITEIDSPYITMQGVPYPVLGISDTGDTQMMYPEEEYEFDGTKVTEFPMAKNGLRQEQKGLVNLDNLLNFTNYNTKQPGGWLDKY